MTFNVKSKIAQIIIAILVFLFLSFFIYSKVVERNRNPLEEEFYGVVSKVKRLYPSLVEFEFNNQNKSYYKRRDLEVFKKSVSIGDSIAKVKNDSFLTVFKKQENAYLFYKNFNWD
tara:strand:+ start:58 stop:405 length:348 start_codon:yes stop_codon:yes gene_type:complete